MKGSSGPRWMMLITLLIHFPFSRIARVRSAVEGFQTLIALIILTTKHGDHGRICARSARAALLRARANK